MCAYGVLEIMVRCCIIVRIGITLYIQRDIGRLGDFVLMLCVPGKATLGVVCGSTEVK